MSLRPTEYTVTCDVHGCEASDKGGLDKLNQLGWRQRVASGGQLTLIAIEPFSPPSSYLCHNCAAQGYEKTMSALL